MASGNWCYIETGAIGRSVPRMLIRCAMNGKVASSKVFKVSKFKVAKSQGFKVAQPRGFERYKIHNPLGFWGFKMAKKTTHSDVESLQP
jgi:hypothetical protein